MGKLILLIALWFPIINPNMAVLAKSIYLVCSVGQKEPKDFVQFTLNENLERASVFMDGVGLVVRKAISHFTIDDVIIDDRPYFIWRISRSGLFLERTFAATGAKTLGSCIIPSPGDGVENDF